MDYGTGDGVYFAAFAILITPFVFVFWTWALVRRFREQREAADQLQKRAEAEFNKLKEKNDD